jgi:hypothetical protein
MESRLKQSIILRFYATFLEKMSQKEKALAKH